MENGRASKTALRVAIRRAAHQIADPPPILDDPIAVPLVGPGYERDMERAMHRVARDFRAYLAARSRFAEDRLAEAVRHGVQQYVILGAGLDTFAYRNPFPSLHVFEVDFPSTQEWKRTLLDAAGVAIPRRLSFVPFDFENQALGEALAAQGFDPFRPSFFGWLGVVPYLTLAAFRATLAAIATLPAGTGISFDYALRPETLSPERRRVFQALSQRLAAAGEPFRLFFTSDELRAELSSFGFGRVEQVDFHRLNELYFSRRRDGLKLSPSGAGNLAVAWV